METPNHIPESLWWARDIAQQFTAVNGVKVRWISVGEGPSLVLLHTLRTQLDIFHKVIPRLQKSFTIHALDYPGHGYSDIPEADYTPQFFAAAVEAFLKDREIQNATVAGVSIGASIALMLAARHNPRIDRVVAVNPYDYLGGGVGRGNAIANVVFTMLKLPVFGPMALFLNNRIVERKMFEGGVAEASSLATEFSDELFAVGRRPGYAKAFLNLVRHVDLWDDIKTDYPNIKVPVLLVYGESDWALADERATTTQLIPDVQMHTVQHGGHFLVLDQPARVSQFIEGFGAA